DAPADDPRHQFGDDLLVAEPVLDADDGRAGQGGPRAADRRPRMQRLGGDQAEVARGQVTPVGAGADLGGEVRQPGDPQAARRDRVHVLGPGIDGPYLDTGHARQVRGVQAPDRAAADHGDADHDASSAFLAIWSQTAGSPPPSTTATAIRTPRRAAASMAASQSPRAQSSWAWRPAGGAGAMPRLSAGSTARSPKRCSQRFWSSPCCPVYGTPRA